MLHSARTILTTLVVSLLAIAGNARAEHVFWEMGIAEVTTGFDIDKNETTIRKWNIGAIGPENLEGVVLQHARSCAIDSLQQAALAAYPTPGEVSAKLAVAWQVWTTLFPKCMSGKAVGKAIVSQFKIGLTENMYRVKGLNIKAKTYETQAGMYAQLYERLGAMTGGDVGKAFKGYAAIEGKIDAATRVDIDIKVPQELTSGLARAKQLSPDEAAKQLAGLAGKIKLDKLDVKIPSIAPQVMKVSQQAVAQIDAALKPFSEPLAAILPKLPSGNPIAELPAALGSAGQAIVKGTPVPGTGGVTYTPVPTPVPVGPAGGGCYNVTVAGFTKRVCP